MLNGVKSDFILKKLKLYLNQIKYLKIFKYTKNFQQKLNIDINEYKTFLQIEIELKIYQDDPYLEGEGENFINYAGNKSNYHIYFENEEKESKRNYISKKDNISKIRIIIDRDIKSFKELFSYSSAREINFIKFNRKDITNMNSMFKECSYLNKLYLSNFNTENVSDMRNMFSFCSELKELDLSKFNTSNVLYMNNMFECCAKLEHLDLKNFDTSKVLNMSSMFSYCESLRYLDLGNFNTIKVTDMSFMFEYCSSLKKIEIKNFNTENVINMRYMFKKCKLLMDLDISKFKLNNLLYIDFMFTGCSKELKNKIRSQIVLKEEAFYNKFGI